MTLTQRYQLADLAMRFTDNKPLTAEEMQRLETLSRIEAKEREEDNDAHAWFAGPDL